MPVIIGIDPGKNGAIAAYDSATGAIGATWAMPQITVSRGKKRRDEVDWAAYAELLWQIKLNYAPSLLVVEQVHSMPRQGIASAFTFGDTYGGQRQLAIHILGCRIELVAPHTWKSAMRIGTALDDIYRAACNRWPGWAWKTPRGRICHDLCEAALLAAYGHRLLEAGK